MYLVLLVRLIRNELFFYVLVLAQHLIFDHFGFFVKWQGFCFVSIYPHKISISYVEGYWKSMLRKQEVVQKLWYCTAAGIDKQWKTISSIRLVTANGLMSMQVHAPVPGPDQQSQTKPSNSKYQIPQSPNNLKPQTRLKYNMFFFFFYRATALLYDSHTVLQVLRLSCGDNRWQLAELLVSVSAG